jgi:hypothetical protein
MSNYRIYFKGMQISPCPNTVWKTPYFAGTHIKGLELKHPDWKGQLEARSDLDPITVSHGKPEKPEPGGKR